MVRALLGGAGLPPDVNYFRRDTLVRSERFRRRSGRAAVGSVLAGTGLVGAAMVLGPPRHAFALDSVYECNKVNGGRQAVLEVNHSTGAITTYSGTTTAPIQAAIDKAMTNTTQPSSAGSGSGDTVIVCHGTYRGDISIGTGNDNLTVRSEDGPNGVVILGDGAAPVVTIDDRGLSFGGPAEGFTISVAAPSATSVVGVQEGVPGAQNTANEDEQCTTAGVPTSSGCDQAAPADVTVNDQLIDNVFTNFQAAPGASVTAVKLDNTINSVLQQNVVKHLVASGASTSTVTGFAIGGFGETPPSPTPAGYQSGDSTNINAALFQNTVDNLVNGACATVQGIQLNGFLLDAHAYNNWLQQLADNTTASCAVTGIFSNAYGYLENEQTGTLVPVNANIDNNSIEQLSNKGATRNTEAIVLEPTPASANPPKQAPPPTCVPQLGQSCTDSIPPSSYTVVQNELQGVYTAVDDEALLGANSFIRFNNFDGDAVGVMNGAAGGNQNTALDATNDWWGCELPGSTPPPGAPGGSPKGCAALVSPPGATSWAPPQTSRVEGAGDGAGNNAGNT